jgi:4-alpha-glucanotransferase
MNLQPDKKIAGVLVPLFALRGQEDLGIGDTAALRQFIDWAAGIGFKIVQLLPINETGADNSPYNAISAMAIDPATLHLAPNLPPDLTREDFEVALTSIDLAGLRRGRVKYRPVKQLKQRILEKAFANFCAHADEKRQAEFRKFCEEESSWLRDYAFFRVLIAENNGSAAWDRWAQQHQTIEVARRSLRDLAQNKQAALTRRCDFFVT